MHGKCSEHLVLRKPAHGPRKGSDRRYRTAATHRGSDETSRIRKEAGAVRRKRDGRQQPAHVAGDIHQRRIAARYPFHADGSLRPHREDLRIDGLPRRDTRQGIDQRAEDRIVIVRNP